MCILMLFPPFFLGGKGGEQGHSFQGVGQILYHVELIVFLPKFLYHPVRLIHAGVTHKFLCQTEQY